ncbi:hypothetical protein [Myxococcus sp. CA040A]|uniref:hypothetical protein n=1 Tax=Myxococcus sp. CA040A TaxID=2741738 RepID=UPI00157A4108|nr:hypothetical protein [Myxococcus sp. CA040A]NTX07019.1 hypothetical protein [Myxococcus sp. CA040A]
MKRFLAVLLLALSSIAQAGTLNIGSLATSNAETLGIPRESQIFYREWRQGAIRYTQLLAANEDVEKRVGKPLDVQGARCILWTKLAELALETRDVLRARASAQGRQDPAWVAGAAKRAQKRADEECQDPKDDNGGTRGPNLGRRYMEELAKSRPSRSELVRDEELLHALGSLVGAIEDAVQSLPARAGTALQAGSTSVPILNPRLFLRRECQGVECAL